MKLVSFHTSEGSLRLGLYVDEKVYDLHNINPHLPDNMSAFLGMGERGMDLARITEREIREGCFGEWAMERVPLAAPVPFPASCRDAYAFRQHVATSRKNRNLDMIPEFDQFPVFYFTNHQAIYGPGPIVCMPDHFHRLDFELEVAIVLNRRGRNIKAQHADQYIAGYMIMNDISARQLQMEEMKLNLGPAKGKDFATALGPWLVTPDELELSKTFAPEGHVGDAYGLDMTCKVNGMLVSSGNLAEMDWTFAEIIERVSYGVEVFPGDVIGSGTVGTGCFLELNGTGRRADPNYVEQWLQANDVVEMEVKGLGKLLNTIVPAETDQRILKYDK